MVKALYLSFFCFFFSFFSFHVFVTCIIYNLNTEFISNNNSQISVYEYDSITFDTPLFSDISDGLYQTVWT